MKKVVTMLLLITMVALVMQVMTVYAIADEVVEQPVVEETKKAQPTVTQTEGAVIIQQPAVTIDLTGIVLAIIGVLGSIVIAYVIPLLKTERAKKLAVIAVQAAEQLFTTGVIDDKLAYAEQWLYKHGIKADRRVLIEAAVAELNKFKQELEYESEFMNPPDYDDLDKAEVPAEEIEETNEELPVCDEGCNIE